MKSNVGPIVEEEEEIDILKEYEEMRRAKGGSSSFSPNFNSSGYEQEISDISQTQEDEEVAVKAKAYFVLKPASKWVKVVSLLATIASCFEWIEIPFSLAFKEAEANYIYESITILYAIQFVMKCRTSYFCTVNGDEVVIPSLILKNYARTLTFYIDLLVAIPVSSIMQLFMSQAGANLFKLGHLLKIATVWKDSYWKN